MSVSTFYTAITGLDSFGSALSIVADNVANANTTAYKANTAQFGDIVSGYLSTNDMNTKAQGAGTTLAGVTTNFGGGSAVPTGNWSDLMIQGDGFFSVKDASAVTHYTRDGSFRIVNNLLTDKHGDAVIGSDGNSITVDPTQYSGLKIDQSGQIWGTDIATGTETPIGTPLQVTTFSNPEGLIRTGDNLYTAGSSCGAPINGTAGSGRNGFITSGSLESSNVDLTKEMVNMITYQADYQANSKSIETANTMLQTILGIIR